MPTTYSSHPVYTPMHAYLIPNKIVKSLGHKGLLNLGEYQKKKTLFSRKIKANKFSGEKDQNFYLLIIIRKKNYKNYC